METPDTVEGAAAFVLMLILLNEASEPEERVIGGPAAILDLFAECVRTAMGERVPMLRRAH